MTERVPGICGNCKRRLFVGQENGLCLMCENESLKGRVAELELTIATCRREKHALYEKLSRERLKSVGKE